MPPLAKKTAAVKKPEAPAKKAVAKKEEPPAKKVSKKSPLPPEARDLATPEVMQAEAADKKKETEAAAEKAKPTVLLRNDQPRDTVYPDVKASVYRGEKPLIVDTVKVLLGWEYEQPGYTFGDDYDVMDLYGKKVRLSNNRRNRSFDIGLAKTWASEILNRHWKLNGETIIVGKTGLILSGQHRLVGLVLACQEYERHKTDWEHIWKEAPSIECIIVFGIDETDETVNTIDTGRPRSFADVLFRSSGVFKKITKESERKAVSRITAYAVKMVWSRTGAGRHAFSMNRTHADSMDFLMRHPRLMDCVYNVWTEDDGKNRRLSIFLSAGYTAGLLFLMGCSATEPETYRKSEQPNEDMLDWSLEDKAWEFFTALAGGSQDFVAVRTALRILINSQEPDGSGVVASIQERVNILVKAWNLFAQGNKITEQALALEYTTDERGNRHLSEFPTVGGIDQGTSKDDDETETEGETPEPELKPETSAKGLKPADLPEGQKVKVTEADGEAWNGTIVDTESTKAGLFANVKDNSGKVYPVAFKLITIRK